jgi:hypothetical protein
MEEEMLLLSAKFGLQANHEQIIRNFIHQILQDAKFTNHQIYTRPRFRLASSSGEPIKLTNLRTRRVPYPDQAQ